MIQRRDGGLDARQRAAEQQNHPSKLSHNRTAGRAEFRSLLQPDFEIYWPPSLPYGGTFSGLEPTPNGWVQPGSLSRPRKQKERWTRASSRLTIAMWWFCGISGVSAPKAFGSTERCLGSTHFEKASSLAHRCFISIRPRWLVFWRRRDIEQDDNRARAGHVETSAGLGCSCLELECSWVQSETSFS